MDYKLIAIDIDGTLLNDQYQVSPSTVEAVNQALERCHLVLCTGRSLFSSKHIVAHFVRPFPLITDNGATVWDPQSGVIRQQTIPYDAVKKVLVFCREHHFHVDFTTSEGVYVEILTEEMLDMYEKYQAIPVKVDDLLTLQQMPVKMTITSYDRDQLRQAFWQLGTQLGNQMKLYHSGQYFIDCMASGVSKGDALQNYAQYLGVSMQQTIAIGNYYNDLEMIAMAGLGIAVANAPADILEQADYVTASNNDEGVRQVLETYVLAKRP